MCGVCLVGRNPALGDGGLARLKEACVDWPGELGQLATQGPLPQEPWRDSRYRRVTHLSLEPTTEVLLVSPFPVARDPVPRAALPAGLAEWVPFLLALMAKQTQEWVFFMTSLEGGTESLA